MVTKKIIVYIRPEVFAKLMELRLPHEKDVEETLERAIDNFEWKSVESALKSDPKYISNLSKNGVKVKLELDNVNVKIQNIIKAKSDAKKKESQVVEYIIE